MVQPASKRLVTEAKAASSYAALTSDGRETLLTKNAVAMRPWHAALGNRDNARATAVCIGDSTTEGVSALDLRNTWPQHLSRALRSRFPLITPVAGGDGYYASWLGNSVPGPATPGGTKWTYTGSPSLVTSFGLGRREAQFTAAGTASVTFTGTDAVLFYGKGNNAAGSFTWAIDGGAATTVSWTGTILDGNTVNITGLTAGTHTLVVTWVSGEVHIDGLWTFNGDFAKGVHVLDSGHAGYAVTNYSVNTFWLKSVAACAPSLITIQLGFNDQRVTTVSSATYQTNLTAFIAQIRAAYTAPCSILLVANYQPTGTFTEPWANYVAAMHTIAAADPTIALLDLTLRMEPAVAANVNGLYSSDLLHPSPAGYGFIGQLVARAVQPE